jgi:hypothetical protein
MSADGTRKDDGMVEHGPGTGRESRLERQLLEMKVHAELQRRDLEASGIGYPALLGARSRFYLLEDDSALVDVMTRLEMYRRRHLN